MLFGIMIGALGIYLLATGSIPTGRFPGFFSSSSNTASIFMRIGGGMILAALILPHAVLGGWHGGIVLLGGSLVMVFIGIVVSLSGRAR